MSKSERRPRDAAFKAKVALEALRMTKHPVGVGLGEVRAAGHAMPRRLCEMRRQPLVGCSTMVAPGTSRVAAMRFGALPQVMSNFVSYALLRFEINVREAAVVGFVGAGGIGTDLLEAIRKFYYSDVSAILVLIVITVALTSE